MKLLSNKLFTIILTIVLISQFSFSQQEKIKLFDNYLTEYVTNKNVPSISAGVYKDGKITWLGVKGSVDLEDKDPAMISSVYRIASITKPITAVAVMQLYEKGLIDLDKEIQAYVPYFPSKKWKITVRNLLNHTSGIRGYKDDEFHNKKFFATTTEAIKVFAYDSLNFEPGTKYEYTSLGYSLLAAVVENMAKMTFENYLIKNIFTPAGMKNTMVDRQKEVVPNRVKGYEKDFERKFVNAPLADLSIKVAGGGLISNSEDLLLFSKALLQGKLIKPATFNLMCTQSKLNNGSKLYYGLGFALSFENDSLKSISHTGGGTGFSTMLLIYPKLNLATIHLINISDRNLGLPAQELANIELGSSYTTPTKTISDELMLVYRSAGIDSAISKYYEIINSNNNVYTINENELIYFSKDLIGLYKTFDAIQYLKNVLKKYPKSLSVIVAMGDAYSRDNNNGLALKHYRMAWQLNPNDAHINQMIERLSKK